MAQEKVEATEQFTTAMNEPVDELPVPDFAHLEIVLEVLEGKFISKEERKLALTAFHNYRAYLRTITLLKEAKLAYEHMISAEFHMREINKKIDALTALMEEQLIKGT